MPIQEIINGNTGVFHRAPFYTSIFATRRRSTVTRPYISSELEIGAMEARADVRENFLRSKHAKRYSSLQQD